MTKEEKISMIALSVTIIVSLAFWFGQVLTYAH
jgi:hypothetical protein